MKKSLIFLVLLGMLSACSDREPSSVSKEKTEGAPFGYDYLKKSTNIPRTDGNYSQLKNQVKNAEKLRTKQPQLPDSWGDPND